MGRGCDEALLNEKKRFSVKREGAIQCMRGLVRISTGKAIQCNSVKRSRPFGELQDSEN